LISASALHEEHKSNLITCKQQKEQENRKPVRRRKRLLLWHFLPVISTAANHPLGFPVHPTTFKSHSTQQQQQKNWTQVHVTMVPNSSSISKFFKCIKEPTVFKKQPG
jgi:hypothetical protein